MLARKRAPLRQERVLSPSPPEQQVAVGMFFMLYSRECLWHKKFVADMMKDLCLRPGACFCTDEETTTSKKTYDFAIPTRTAGGCGHVFHVV